MSKNNSGWETILMLLLIIPIAFGIFYGTQYLLGNPSSSDSSSEDSDKGSTFIDVYVNGLKVESKEYTYTLPQVGDSVLVDFKKKSNIEYYEGKIIFTPNFDANQYLQIIDNFDTGQFVQTKITLLGFTNDARVVFSDENYSFNFILNIKAEFKPITSITIPGTSIWS